MGSDQDRSMPIQVQESLRSFDSIHLNSEGNIVDQNSQSDLDYFLISIPGNIPLESLHNKNVTVDSNSNVTQISDSNLEYEEIKESSKQPQMFFQPLSQSNDETIVSACSVKAKLKFSKVLSSSKKDKRMFVHLPPIPNLPTNNIRKCVLFGSNIGSDHNEDDLDINIVLEETNERKSSKQQADSDILLNNSDVLKQNFQNNLDNKELAESPKKKKKKKRKLHDDCEYDAPPDSLLHVSDDSSVSKTKKKKRKLHDASDDLLSTANTNDISTHKRKKKKHKHSMDITEESTATEKKQKKKKKKHKD